MIKKSKKILALSLSLVNLVSFMGSFNIHAGGVCSKPSLVGIMRPTGFTETI